MILLFIAMIGSNCVTYLGIGNAGKGKIVVATAMPFASKQIRECIEMEGPEGTYLSCQKLKINYK